ncbi:hypothetical protein G7Y89_g10156 [Cudoniella acicularis]|uniref:Ent-kaurene synthase n=1 Tax=Cudoniella acicularis TaxID=354080 RepID=A0A8H4VZC0_9HELO|nr:hypothetical protein G7Y89_g10156 [Cudoniella acicularis]
MRDTPMDPVNDNDEALILISQLVNGCNRPCGGGSMSPSIYDTAWLAMIQRHTDGKSCWLFPECFQYLLRTQLEDGGWPSYASQVDGILNTMASLLALLKHSADFQQSPRLNSVWNSEARINGAKDSLQIQLEHWNLELCDHVGFEILTPSLLTLLGQHGVTFTFPGKKLLLELNQNKLSRFDTRDFYTNSKTTTLHSMEAFIGKIDFDRVSHHKTAGAFMGSPASTAAYLMSCSTWDSDAESYLRTVITEGTGRGNGGVPCAFPTNIFEITWVTSTLLQAGFTVDSLGSYNIKILAGVLESELKNTKGVVGFDADDTAKAILTLNLLGIQMSAEAMISTFESRTHFKTYPGERTPSFSANCNVLNALLHASEPSCYSAQIWKTATFVCKSFMRSTIKDKWNISSQYSILVLAQALRKLLVLWDQEILPNPPETLLKEDVPVVLIQILNRTLCRQNPDGSWGNSGSYEETAYALLTLVDASKLPWTTYLDNHVRLSIELGQNFLLRYRQNWGDASYTWVEKVSYKSSVLSKAYCIAANKAAILYPSIDCSWSSNAKSLAEFQTEKINKFTKFFSRLPLFAGEPVWRLQASIIESHLFLPRLRRIRLDIFPRKDMEEDKYLEYIPLTWTACNNSAGSLFETDLLWDMMVISMLNYQADEFMETIAGIENTTTQNDVRQIIYSIYSASVKRTCSEFTTSADVTLSSGDEVPSPRSSEDLQLVEDKNHAFSGEGNPDRSILSVEITLRRFADHVLQNPWVATASTASQNELAGHLKDFLLAHVAHSADNAQFLQQQQLESHQTFSAGTAFYDWLHHTSAVNTSCPYSFAWLACRIGEGKESFPDAITKYLARDLAVHLAAMCRMYNDYGSIARDRAEGNLNSVDFSEFAGNGARHENSCEASNGSKSWEEENLEMKKKSLIELAEYERSCVLATKERLVPLVSERVADIFNVFINVTDLYGQIYVARDIASRMR